MAGNCELIKKPCYKDNKKRKVIKDRLELGSGLRPSFPQLGGDPRFINSVNGVDGHQSVLPCSCSFFTFWDISAPRGCLAKANRKSIRHEALPCRLPHTCHLFIRSVNDTLMEELDRIRHWSHRQQTPSPEGGQLIPRILLLPLWLPTYLVTKTPVISFSPTPLQAPGLMLELMRNADSQVPAQTTESEYALSQDS